MLIALVLANISTLCLRNYCTFLLTPAEQVPITEALLKAHGYAPKNKSVK